MSTRCKPGDLAVIVNDEPQCTANIGCIVEVGGPLRTDFNGLPAWQIRPITSDAFLIAVGLFDSVRLMEYQETGIEHPDAWMFPIVSMTDDCEVEEKLNLVITKEVEPCH